MRARASYIFIHARQPPKALFCRDDSRRCLSASAGKHRSDTGDHREGSLPVPRHCGCVVVAVCCRACQTVNRVAEKRQPLPERSSVFTDRHGRLGSCQTAIGVLNAFHGLPGFSHRIGVFVIVQLPDSFAQVAPCPAGGALVQRDRHNDRERHPDGRLSQQATPRFALQTDVVLHFSDRPAIR